MRPMILLVALLTLGLSQSFAGEATVTFEGESFEGGYVGNPTPDEHVLEFLPKMATRETWLKKVTYRYERLPGLGNDPEKAAQLMANMTKSFSTRAETRISTSGNEALLDSTSLTRDEKYIILNVYRYAKSTDGEAVISVQVAYRVKVVTMPAPWEDVVRYKNGLDYVRNARSSWRDRIGAFDMKHVEAELIKTMHNSAVNPDAAR